MDKINTPSGEVVVTNGVGFRDDKNVVTPSAPHAVPNATNDVVMVPQGLAISEVEHTKAPR